jgi:dTDP-4-dehydrorhamnose reductase
MRVLLTGGSGQLGTELCKLRDYVAPSEAQMDITRPDQVADTLREVQPDLLFHAAAYTNTALPDRDPAEAAECWRVNVLGTRNLLQARCPILFVSTENAAHPYNFYCLTKLQAEFEVARHRYGYTIARTNFRDDPFEYPQACTDMWTLGDTVGVIAKLLDAMLYRSPTNCVVYVGTGLKTVYELAVQSRPDVRPVRRRDISPILPPMDELRRV